MDFERFFEDSIDLVCCMTPDGYIERMNRQWSLRLGWTNDQLRSKSIFSFLHPDDRAPCSIELAQLARHNAAPSAHGIIEAHENRLIHRDGNEIWFSWNITSMNNGLLAVTARDITDWVVSRQELDEQTRFQEMAASLANVGYWEHNPEKNETYWSDTLCTIFGVPPGDPRVGPEFARSRLHPVDRRTVRRKQDAAWKNGQSFEYKVRLYRPDGECRHVHTNAHCETTSGSGESGTFFGVTKDITDHERAMLALKHAALHDGLTNLPNRKNFNDRLIEALNHTQRYGRKTAVVLLDLDNFKDINDTLGHQVGDELLVQVSMRLKSALNDGETIARLGGDEFAVIQSHNNQPVQSEALCNRVVKLLESPFEIEDNFLTIGCSLGVAIAPADGVDAATLLRNADIALYKAKTDGRGIYRFFHSEMDTRLRARRQLETELKQAITNEEFELYYQPVFDTETNKLCSLEALIRWRNPDRGLMTPDDFIPLAEQTGLIVPIGQWVVRKACQEAATWPASVRVAINVSAAEFRSDELLESITNALSAARLEPGRLEVEITESALLKDGQKALRILHQLHKLGVMIVLDDFGMGYSSLSYLRSFPFDKLKIDSSFVRESAQHADDRAIVSAVAEMAKALGIESTAEGVENLKQLDVVSKEGYGQVQGFLYSEPRPASEIYSEYFADEILSTDQQDRTQ